MGVSDDTVDNQFTIVQVASHVAQDDEQRSQPEGNTQDENPTSAYDDHEHKLRHRHFAEDGCLALPDEFRAEVLALEQHGWLEPAERPKIRNGEPGQDLAANIRCEGQQNQANAQ